MEVYGAGYADDVDYFKYNRRNTETHTESMVKQLQRVVQCYDLCIFSVEKGGKDGDDRVFRKHFLCLLNFQRSVFRKLLKT